MICQKCKQSEANVYFKQVINDRKTEMYLCETCAREKGLKSIEIPFGINDFLSKFIGLRSIPLMHYMPLMQDNKSFDKFGIDYQNLQGSCDIDYDNYYDALEEDLREILMRNNRDFGNREKVPSGKESKGKDIKKEMFKEESDSIKKVTEIEKLKAILAKAIEREDYEQAAEIRDKIKALE